MNRNSDPSCSHDFKGKNIEYDKTIIEPDKQKADPQADSKTSDHQEPLKNNYEDIPSIRNVSGKRKFDAQNEERMTSGSNKQITWSQYDDLRNGNDALPVVDVIDKQIDDDKTDISSHEKDPEYTKTILPVKCIQNNQITKPIVLNNNKTDRQTSLKGYTKDVLTIIKILENQAVNPKVDMEYNKGVPPIIDSLDMTTVESPAPNDSRNHRQSQECNEFLFSFIKALDKQIVKPKTEVKLCTNKSQTLYENVYVISDELDNQSNSDEALRPKALRLASTLSSKEILKLQQPGENPSMSLRSTATLLRILSNLPSPISSMNISPNQPRTLFLLALSKLNESAINFAVDSLSKCPDSLMCRTVTNHHISPELTPPASLGSAPPSYSFVLRQMAVRRRPRMFATFKPSPSFIQHTPPPTYTASFDIYLDNVHPPPTRVYNFGFAPMLVVCPDCGYTGMTQVTAKITLCTHLCAFTLCLMCCWICVPLPYIMRSCKDVYHYCRNCRSFLGVYCPTNPENITIR